MSSESKLESAEAQISEIPGHRSGVGWSYFLMLCGSTGRIKADRKVIRFLESALGRAVDTSEAEALLVGACKGLAGEE